MSPQKPTGRVQIVIVNGEPRSPYLAITWAATARQLTALAHFVAAGVEQLSESYDWIIRLDQGAYTVSSRGQGGIMVYVELGLHGTTEQAADVLARAAIDAGITRVDRPQPRHRRS